MKLKTSLFKFKGFVLLLLLFAFSGCGSHDTVEIYVSVEGDDLKDFMEIKDNTLYFTGEIEKGSVFMGLKGFSRKVKDNMFTIENRDSGAGVTVSVDKPLTKLEFWTNSFVICLENTIQLSVKSGKKEVWISDYIPFVK